MKKISTENVISTISVLFGITLMYFLIKDFKILFKIYVLLFPVLLTILVIYNVFKFYRKSNFKESLFPTNGVILVIFLLGISYAFIYFVGGFETYIIKLLNICQDYYYDDWY